LQFISFSQVQMAKHASQRQDDSNSPIPDKLYFRIGEVAKLCGIEAYVLRFWESEFPQLRINKSGTGQRLYRKRDVELVLRIKRLLYSERYTIAGARQVFASEVKEPRKKAQAELPLKQGREETAEAKLTKLRSELKEILGMLSAPPAKTSRLTASPRETRSQRKSDPGLFDR
jgi:DNA-binding transcriptional MerR regulator